MHCCVNVSDEQLRAAVNAGGIGVWELDLFTNRLDASLIFKETFGLEPDSFSFLEMQSAVHSDDVVHVRSAVQRCIETSADFREEFRVSIPGRDMAWIELRAQVVCDAVGTPQRLIGISVDVTKRRLVEEDLRQNGILLHAVLETAPGLIYAKDHDGRMLIANPPTLDLIGKAWADVRGRTDAEFLDDRIQGELVMANDRRVVAGGKTVLLEEPVGMLNGRPRIWLSAKAPLRDDQGATMGLVGVSQDITDRKLAEEELLKLNETLEARVADRTEELQAKAAQLEVANKELESFSYSVSHDLRAPLRAIDGFALIIEEDFGGVDAKFQRYLSVIRENAKRMGDLIDDLLAFSQLGRVALTAREIDIGLIVEEALREVLDGQEYAEPQVVIGVLPRILGDRNLLRQVWINLISNAVKYTSKTTNAKIEISGYEEGEESIFCVKDNGVGFDMDYADKLFGVFHRLHRNEEFSGTGVGLAIVHRVIGRHGGRVWARGQVNQGAAFYFALPRAINSGVALALTT